MRRQHLSTAVRTLVVALAAFSMAACATVQKLDAAADVHALLISIRDSDEAAFDTLVDRPALKQEIQARLLAEGRKDDRLSGFAALIAPSLAEIAGEALVQPDVFRQVADYYGYTPQTKIPNVVAISQALKPLPDGRVCAVRKQGGPCMLVFTKATDGHWKLSGFEGDLSMLRVRR